jgi:hypothetical protein
MTNETAKRIQLTIDEVIEELDIPESIREDLSQEMWVGILQTGRRRKNALRKDARKIFMRAMRAESQYGTLAVDTL